MASHDLEGDSSRTGRTGWRPHETEEAFHNLLTRLGNATPQNLVEEVPRPEYSGRPHEDPHAFLLDLEDYVASRNPTTDRRRVLLALACLKDEARRRLEPLVSLGLRWDEFRPKLLALFDDDATRRRITLTYLGTPQKAGESAEEFIRTKQLLAQRINPRTAQADLINTIRDLLQPQIRLYLRGAQLTTVADLIQEASAVEDDLRQLPRASGPAPPARRAAPTPAPRNYEPAPRDREPTPSATTPRPLPQAQASQQGPNTRPGNATLAGGAH